MSILKIRKETTPHTTDTAEVVIEKFNTFLDLYVETEDRVFEEDCVEQLLKLYATFSYIYLTTITITLKADEDKKATLAFMNSVLAEILHEMEIAYFHKELGYSITDQAVSYFLDNGEDGFGEHIDAVIVEMNKPLEEEAEAERIIAEVEDKLKKKAENQSTLNNVKGIITEHLNVTPEEITEESRFVEDLGADSLDLVELLMTLEAEHDIEIPDDQAEKLITVGSVVQYIDNL